MYADPTLSREDVCLTPADTLLLMTDGVTEARGAQGCYGEQRPQAAGPTVVRG